MKARSRHRECGTRDLKAGAHMFVGCDQTNSGDTMFCRHCYKVRTHASCRREGRSALVRNPWKSVPDTWAFSDLALSGLPRSKHRKKILLDVRLRVSPRTSFRCCVPTNSRSSSFATFGSRSAVSLFHIATRSHLCPLCSPTISMLTERCMNA